MLRSHILARCKCDASTMQKRGLFQSRMGEFAAAVVSVLTCASAVRACPVVSPLRPCTIPVPPLQVRLIKLIRLAKLARLVKRWEARVSISYSVISLTKSTIGICVFCHWMGARLHSTRLHSTRLHSTRLHSTRRDGTRRDGTRLE